MHFVFKVGDGKFVGGIEGALRGDERPGANTWVSRPSWNGEKQREHYESTNKSSSTAGGTRIWQAGWTGLPNTPKVHLYYYTNYLRTGRKMGASGA
jgi:hypothetical protein